MGHDHVSQHCLISQSNQADMFAKMHTYSECICRCGSEMTAPARVRRKRVAVCLCAEQHTCSSKMVDGRVPGGRLSGICFLRAGCQWGRDLTSGWCLARGGGGRSPALRLSTGACSTGSHFQQWNKRHQLHQLARAGSHGICSG